MSDFTPIRILLVEDDEDCVNLTRKTLEGAGILNGLEVVHTGKEALSAVRIFPPHVILLDWVLPDMSGSEVLQGIKCVSRDIVVIILSAHIPERMEVGGCTPDYYISKPIDPIQFMMVLKSVGRFGFSVVDLRTCHEHSCTS